jgi:mono/diheme cytochrome c family protein
MQSFSARIFHVFRLLLCVTLLSGITVQAADEPVLQLQLSNQKQKLARSNLLRHPATRTITIPDDPVYKRTMTYMAVPLSAILRDIRNFHSLQFKAADGFAADIPVNLLLSASEPWIAIEPAGKPWPEVKPGGPGAGAFYLVWLTPEKSGITPEQWPFQLVSISDVEPLQQRYPQIVPDAAADSPAYRGMRVFAMQCAVCHRLNGGGDGTIGPDLNKPFNPTEYFHEDFLRKLIRDPASVRSWPQSVMPGFSETTLSSEQLDDLLAYLRQMAKQKVPVKPE